MKRALSVISSLRPGERDLLDGDRIRRCRTESVENLRGLKGGDTLLVQSRSSRDGSMRFDLDDLRDHTSSIPN